MTLQRQFRCPGDREAWLDIQVNPMTGPHFCSLWCATAAGHRDGPFVGASLRIRPRAIQGQYRDQKPEGRWIATFFGPAGPVRVGQEDYRAGKLHGTSRRWTESGNLELEQHFDRGRRVGPYQRFYRDGKPAQRGQFALGTPLDESERLVDIWPVVPLVPRDALSTWDAASVPIGEWSEWYENGPLASKRTFDQRGRPDGEFCYFKFSGARIGCQDLKGGDGTLTEYDSEGKAARRLGLAQGALHGERTEWGESGVVSKEHFKHGQRHGRSERWDDQGRLLRRAEYAEGRLHGPYLEQFWEGDGSREITQGRYCEGNRCGRWVRRKQPGKWREEQTFDKAGELIGERHYDENGVLGEAWSKAGEQRREHQRCLAELARGGCCDPEQRPPPGAKLCENGARPR